MENKKGQMKISFGMIFSIILIVAFIAFAVYAITYFISIGNQVKVGNFYNSLNKDVGKAFQSSEAKMNVQYDLPTKVDQICFTNGKSSNLFVYSKHSVSNTYIPHLNITSNNTCILVNQGSVNFTLTKNFEGNLVRVSK